MVDVHCHILPGIDDGPEDIGTSLAMAESAIADGITHVVATPHASAKYHFDFSRIQELRDELQVRVGGRLALATGCDFHLYPENLAALQEDAPRFCINQRDCLLVEFNEYAIPPSMDQTLHKIQLMGLRPIVTHPERNAILRAQPERLSNWVRLGCYVQITAGSLTGTFGPGAQKDAWRWVADGLVHFVASDAHNTRGRQLKLRPAFDLVSEQFGDEKARALFIENPMAAFEGRELPYVPKLLDKAVPRRKRFFFF
ncbi:MAG TPA: CpsB/CapC family capsule biosynthesis tyrosine phosphatase [Candidatus Methylomirabilis sp.]|nr:CpsB/CapC family capsule biosynthesis tyrosine phosphatase [Candidatus Methylomirabilis sp.]